MNARKERYGAEDLEDFFSGTTKVVAGRGKKSVEFDLKQDVDWAALTKAVLGPSGNLRAPVALTGKTALVGFNEEAWEGVFG